MSDEEDNVQPDIDINEGGEYQFPWDKIKDCKVYGEDEKEVDFASLISGKKMIVFFVRQFGCYVCRDYIKAVVKHMDKYKDALSAAGIEADKNFLIVGCGSASWIKRYRDDIKIPYPVYTDPKRDLFKALAIHRVNSLSDLVSGKTSQYTGSGISGMAWSTKVAMQAAKIDTGDAYQQGAEFVLNADGKATFHYFEKNPNDHPIIEDIFRAAGAVIEESETKPKKEKKGKDKEKEKK